MTPKQLAAMSRQRTRNLAMHQQAKAKKDARNLSIDVWLVTLPLRDKLALKQAWEKARKGSE